MAKNETHAQFEELSNRIEAALKSLGGWKISELRHGSVLSHLGSIASNLEAEVAARGAAAKQAEAEAAKALEAAKEAARKAEEAARAAGLSPGSGTSASPASSESEKTPPGEESKVVNLPTTAAPANPPAAPTPPASKKNK